MKSAALAAVMAALATTGSPAAATAVHGTYTPLGSNAWLADFTILNDGDPAAFAGLSIELADATHLALVASPATWDSVVFQPDPDLPDPGFLDSFVIDPANALAVGQAIGHFVVSFTYAAGAVPGALPFTVYDQAFTPLFAGTTTVSVVPEPAALLLAAVGLAVVGLRVSGARAVRRSQLDEVDA